MNRFNTCVAGATAFGLVGVMSACTSAPSETPGLNHVVLNPDFTDKLDATSITLTNAGTFSCEAVYADRL